MSDDRARTYQLPAPWFPEVRGSDVQAATGGRRADFAGTSGGTLGWDDVPHSVEVATLDSLAPIGPYAGMQPRLPTDRHARGEEFSAQPTERVREVAIGDMPIRQQGNHERLRIPECSRRIAHRASQAAHREWQQRRAGDCTACSAVPQ